MVNEGITPLDPDTKVGQLRILIGDTEYVPISDGIGDYTNFSDAQLESYVSLGSDNLHYGAGYAYMALAAQFASEALRVDTDDLKVDLTARAEAMRRIGDKWFSRGDSALDVENNNFFDLVEPDFKTYGDDIFGAGRSDWVVVRWPR